jgi:hypothetical protein
LRIPLPRRCRWHWQNGRRSWRPWGRRRVVVANGNGDGETLK